MSRNNQQKRLDRRKQFIDLMVYGDLYIDLNELPTERSSASYICAKLEKYIQQL